MAIDSTPDLCDAASWTPFTSGGALCRVSADGASLRLDFDFRGEQGFVGIRRPLEMRLPDPFGATFSVRGQAPSNAFEFKLADPANENAWRWRAEELPITAEPRQITLRESQIEFAWGPAGGGRIRQLGAIEIVVAAGPGGSGTIWIEGLRLFDRASTSKTVISASSQAPGQPPTGVVGKSPNGWKPAAGDAKPWLQFDFQESREFGGLVIDWGPRPVVRQFEVQVSEAGKQWKTAYRAAKSSGTRSFIPLPHGESRFLRLAFQGEVDVRHVDVQAFDFARTKDDLFGSIAKRTPKGSFPRYLLGEQSYWTCAGVVAGTTCALINEEGLVEPDRGTFSLEPFLMLGDELVTWANVRRRIRLEPGGIPIPTVEWKGKGFGLETTAFGVGQGEDATLLIRYRIHNHSKRALRTKLVVAVRPHQVSPPWQHWKEIGGVSEIREITWRHGAVWVNRAKAVVPLSKPSSFGAITFDEGLLVNRLASGKLPRVETLKDEHGLASGALGFTISLRAGGSRDVVLTVPFGFESSPRQATVQRATSINANTAFDDAVQCFSDVVNRVTFQMPAGIATQAADTFRTAVGQILINRDGPALQPGPRRYTRSWIRDGAIMGAALARAGDAPSLAEYVRWYAPFQREDGFVPCCVDRSGPDWLVEHDSHGQLIFAAMEAYRFSGDRQSLEKLWPAMQRAATFIETLCESESKNDSKLEEMTRGLLPISASHEGYLAQPVHSYWDDFWGVRGLVDAAAAAMVLNRPDDAGRFTAAAEAFRSATLNSIRQVIDSRQIAFIPGSVEWADLDPTATANALQLFPDTANLPAGPLKATMDQYLTNSGQRRGGKVWWKNYSAYEIRIVSALVRLGWRTEAQDCLEFYLSDRRPRAWNQWPEISWRNPRSPGHLGDVPHTWIGSEYIHLFTSLFAYERESDNSLVLAAGIPENWISRRRLAVQGLPTWYGPLDLSLRRLSDGRLEVEVAGRLRIPSGGIVLRPPCPQNVSPNSDGRLREGDAPAEPPPGVSLVLKASIAPATVARAEPSNKEHLSLDAARQEPRPPSLKTRSPSIHSVEVDAGGSVPFSGGEIRLDRSPVVVQIAFAPAGKKKAGTTR